MRGRKLVIPDITPGCDDPESMDSRFRGNDENIYRRIWGKACFMIEVCCLKLEPGIWNQEIER